ncbi:MAG: hypothetical protein IKH75_12445 [Ruminococcus sp.]|nr:hypothetical protein [Ruminococcus sp.]
MNILVICSQFPPDTAIGAVKPYMISKYLSGFGHNVTVVRHGDIGKDADNSYGDYKKGLDVLTVLGDDCDVAKFERGEFQKKPLSSRSFEPSKLNLFIRFVLQPAIVLKRIIVKNNWVFKQKKVIDSLKLQGRTYDIVYSSFYSLENIFSGEYAAKLFNAKWVMEFRDPIGDDKTTSHGLLNICWKIYGLLVTRRSIKNSDICFVVSEGMKLDYKKIYPKGNIHVLYNGFDSDSDEYYPANADKDCFSMCYTGTMYEERACALSSLAAALSQCFDEKRFDRKKVKFKYAGSDSVTVRRIFEENNIEDILEDHGYVSRGEAEQIQQNSDLFLVLSWNTKNSQGILTGKFYEGIRAGRPILSIIWGDTPNSELYMLNKKYHYGYCYESCRGKAADDKLKEFILGMYERKFSDKGITYKPNPDLVQDFHYKNITKKLERLMLELVNEDKK